MTGLNEMVRFCCVFIKKVSPFQGLGIEPHIGDSITIGCVCHLIRRPQRFSR